MVPLAEADGTAPAPTLLALPTVPAPPATPVPPSHRFVVAPRSLKARLEGRRYPKRWADVRGVAEDNDAIMRAGGYVLNGHRVDVLPVPTSAFLESAISLSRKAEVGTAGAATLPLLAVTQP